VSIDHNLFVKDDYVYHANYGAGIHVRKLMDDDNNTTLEEIAYIDLDDNCETVCDVPEVLGALGLFSPTLSLS
jgi:hypothetical protein